MTTKKDDEKPKPKPDVGEAFLRLLQGAGGAIATAVGGAMGERAATAETAAKLLLEELVGTLGSTTALAEQRRAHYEKMFPFLKPNPLRGFTNPPAPFDFDQWLKDRDKKPSPP